jgi:hypothetical protein
MTQNEWKIVIVLVGTAVVVGITMLENWLYWRRLGKKPRWFTDEKDGK